MMTVAELIAKLQEMPQDMGVFYHDMNQDDSPVTSVQILKVNETIWDHESGRLHDIQEVRTFDGVVLG
jgi:SUMO ligase MMS21 Smc5/6 complex component